MNNTISEKNIVSARARFKSIESQQFHAKNGIILYTISVYIHIVVVISKYTTTRAFFQQKKNRREFIC